MIRLQTYGDIAVADAVGTTTLPTLDRVRGEWWFGSTGSGPNLVNAVTGVAATAIGNIAFTPGYASFSYSANTGAKLDMALPFSCVVLFLIRPTLGEPIVMSPGDLSDYNFLFRGSFEASAGQNGAYNGSPQAHLPTPGPANFTLFAGHYSAGELTRIYRIDANSVIMDDADGGYSTNVLRDPAVPIQIGGRVNANIQGNFDLAALAVIEGLPMASFFEEVRPLYRREAIARGIPVNL